jgi:hypothetical protein
MAEEFHKLARQGKGAELVAAQKRQPVLDLANA